MRGVTRVACRSVVAGLLVAGAAWASAHPAADAALPDLPKIRLESLSPPARASVEEALGAVAAHPQDAAANGKLAMLLHSLELSKDAEVCYRRAATLDPASMQWTYLLALAQTDTGMFREAVATLRKTLDLEPAYVPAQLQLGECFLALGEWVGAAQVFEDSLKKNPDNALALYGQGRARAVRHELDGAVQSFLKACELFPKYGAARYALAQTYKRQGLMEPAVEQLNLYEQDKASAPEAGDRFLAEVRVLRASPAEELRQGLELAQQGKPEEAIAALERALRSDPSLLDAHINLMALYARRGDFDRGEEHFLAARQLDLRHPGVYFNHGLLLAGQGRFPEAEREFRRAVEIDPTYPGAHTNLGIAVAAQNRFAEATAEFQQSLASNPDDIPARFGLGRALVNQENFREGIAQLLKCLETTDEDLKPSYVYALGAAYARAGDVKNGQLYLRQAREKGAARGQSQLVESIDQDLQTLESSKPPR